MYSGAVPFVFGEEYAGASAASLALLPGSFAYASLAVLQQVAIRRGLPGFAGATLLAAVLLSLATAYIGARVHGINGAAYGSSLAYVCTLVVGGLALRHRLAR